MVLNQLGSIASAARAFACKIYEQQPGAIVPNPIDDVLYQAWDNFCAPPPDASWKLPPPPVGEAGKCQTPYWVKGSQTIQYRRFNGWDYDPPVTVQFGYDSQEQGISFMGSMSPHPEIKVGYAFGGSFAPFGLNFKSASGLEAIAPIYVSQQLDWNKYSDNTITALSITYVRVDGLPDNCGSEPPSFPPASPPPLGGYTSPPVVINFNDGSDLVINFNFTPPKSSSPPILKMPPIIINYIKPEFNIKIPLEFNFDGTVKFGDGGDSDFGNDLKDLKDKLDEVGNTTNNINNVSISTGDTVNNIRDRYYRDLNRRNNKKPDPDEFEPEEPPKDPGEHKQEFLAAVKVDLTKIPSNAKRQSGNASPDVYYAGWFEWQSGTKSLPREGIHFIENYFIAPEGVDGYAFTLYTGFEGSATEVVRKEVKPNASAN